MKRDFDPAWQERAFEYLDEASDLLSKLSLIAGSMKSKEIEERADSARRSMKAIRAALETCAERKESEWEERCGLLRDALRQVGVCIDHGVLREMHDKWYTDHKEGPSWCKLAYGAGYTEAGPLEKKEST